MSSTFAAAPAFLAITLVLSGSVAWAASPVDHPRAHVIHALVHHRQALAASREAPRFAPPAPYAAAPQYGFRWGPAGYAYYGPGYVFVPHRGILNEDCDLPTSTCTNEVRDVQ